MGSVAGMPQAMMQPGPDDYAKYDSNRNGTKITSSLVGYPWNRKKKTDPNAAEPNPNKVLWREKVSSRAAALTFVRYGAIFSKCNLSAIQLCQSNRNQAQHQGYAAVPQHQ